MKKKTALISAVAAIVLVVILLIVFVKCPGKDIEQKPVQKVFLGGQVIESSTQQIFAKVAVGFPFKNTPYESKVEGLPSNFELYQNNVIYEGFYNIEFYINPPAGSIGQYPYRITIKSDKENYEFEGVVVVGKPTNSDDKVGGNAGKTGYLGLTNVSQFSVTSKTEFGKMLMANPVVFDKYCVIGTSNGELVGVDFEGKILWRTQVTKNIIDTLQRVKNIVIVSDNSGRISTYNIENLAKGDENWVETFKTSATLTGPPTILQEDKIIIGTTDGKVICLSLPNLSKEWEVSLKGTVIGSISAVPIGSGKGNILVNSADKNTYVLDFDGKLQVRFDHQIIPVGSPCANNDTMAVLSATNQIQLRYFTGVEVWKKYCDFEVVGMPVMTNEQVFVYGKNKLRSLSRADGSEQWTIDLPSIINANPVVVGNHIIVPTEDKTVSIIRSNDGLVSYTISIDGSLINWPVLYNDRLFLADRRGVLYIMSDVGKGETTTFDMSKVLTNGACTNVDHNNLVKTSMPQKPKLLWSLKGSFAPAITTIDKTYLYSIDNKEFSCHKTIDGSKIWSLKAEAVEGEFYGFSLMQGFHETPMYFTSKGLLLGTKNGLLLVNPDTGKVLKKSNISGIPQSNGKYIVCTTGKELTVADFNMVKIWSAKGIYYSSNVLIDGDYIFALKRGEGAGEFGIFGIKDGKKIFSHSDTLFDISPMKILTTKRYVVLSTMQGPWVYDKLKAKVNGTSGKVTLSNIMLMDLNYVNNVLYCSTNEFGLEFNLENGEGSLIVPNPNKITPVIYNGGHWMFTPTNYVCMGLIPPKGNPDPDTKTTSFPRLLQIRNLKSEIVSSVKIEASSCEKYGIALGGSTIVISEVSENAKLRVYGP